MLARNSLAHLAARVVSLAAGFVNIPLVSATLGNEALGMVGLQTSLQAMLGLVDLGIPTVANRELAVLSGRGASWESQAVLIRSLETLLWGLAAAFFLCGLALIGPLSQTWLNVHDLPTPTVAASIGLIAAGVAVRFPIALYTNVCFGLGRHMFPNAVVSVAAVLRIAASTGALLVMHVGVVGFFAIQLLAGAAEVAALALGIWWRRDGWLRRPHLGQLRRMIRHSAVLTGISVSAVGLSQVDKVILSKLLPLGEFGLYSAAYSLASGLLAFSYPICNSIFPALSRSFDQGDRQQSGVLVRWGSELTMLLILPAGAAIVAQSQSAADLLFLVKQAAPDMVAILPAMMLGGMAQAFVTVPHFFQIATNRSSRVLWINIAFLPIYIALTYFATNRWGMQGGALSFLAFNLARLVVHWFLLVADRQGVKYWRRLPATVLGMTGISLAIAVLLGRMVDGSAPRIIMLIVTVPILTILVGGLLPGLRGHLGMALRHFGKTR